MSVAQNISHIRERIASACARAGRSPGEVTLVAITKTQPVALIREALNAGITVFGENRVQEAAEKIPELRDGPTWHLVGHLQTNKVKKALSLFSVIQSVDSLRLAQEIQRQAGAAGQVVEVYVEVNTSHEDSKFGIDPNAAPELAQQIAGLPNLRLRGLMTIGALTSDANRVRSCFRRLRELRDAIGDMSLPQVDLETLSMGMTDDFEIAIEEGSTMVRVGRAIFGERN
jgi:pyridoxal phosphate enzyme (YggS family)